MTKEEQLLLVLNRIDSYLGRVDSKANFWITCNIFIIGGIAFNSNLLSKTLQLDWFHVCLINFSILSVLCAATGMLWAFLAISPFLKSGNNKQKNSYTTLLFFGSIAQISPKEYHDELKQSTKESRINDLERQVHLLSIALNHKFERIRKSTQYSLFALLFAVISILLKIYMMINGGRF